MIKTDDVIKAEVTDIETFGIKVKSGNRNGFMQIPEISWDEFSLQNRVNDILSVGDKLSAKVISVTEDLFYCSLRELESEKNPWLPVNLPTIGDSVTGKVVLVAEYGYFVKLPNLSVATMKADKNTNHNEGERLSVRIVDINAEAKKIIVEPV